jgi:hypothetical protein
MWMKAILGSFLLQEGKLSNPLAPLFGAPAIGISLLVAVIVVIGGWKMFEKAGQPGWAIVIPFYNLYIMLKIAGRPGWWLLLYLIPLVNIAIAIVVSIDIAKSFGQGAAFGIILIFLLGGLGYLILGFGNYRYLGPSVRALAARN